MKQTIALEYHDKFIDKVINHYHFMGQDTAKLQALYQAVLPLIQVEAHYVYAPELKVEYKDKVVGQAAENALVFLTLGHGMDQLQDVYMGANCLQEAYMLDCIGLELLTEAYEEFVKMLQRDTSKWAIKMDFLGDNYPLEELPKLHCQVFADSDASITYTPQFLLNPKKSVAFFLPLSEERVTMNPCHVCSQCKNVECIFRQEKTKTTGYQVRKPANVYSYGYQRTFGDQKKEL